MSEMKEDKNGRNEENYDFFKGILSEDKRQEMIARNRTLETGVKLLLGAVVVGLIAYGGCRYGSAMKEQLTNMFKFGAAEGERK